MNNKIKNILQKLIDNGYDAYIVGGFVRDYLLGIENYDVDICTSATPSDVKEIFSLNNSTDDNYGNICFKDKLYNYDITTFRNEIKYENRRPVEYSYASSIEEDVKRRDFTINSLYMDINGNIIDLVDGKKDLDNKIIRVVGNINDKMVEDPLRLLRAIRFASILDFEIDKNLEIYIKQNKQLISSLSFTRKKEELNKIFKINSIRGLNLIKEYGYEDILKIKIPDDIKASNNELAVWALLDFSDEYNFSNQEKDTINSIKKIIKYGKIDNTVLYEYGLYNSIIAGEILGIDKANISDIYKNMPIYTEKDIDIKGDDIIKLLNIEPSSQIKNILSDIEINILNNTLENNKEKISEYIIKNWK